MDRITKISQEGLDLIKNYEGFSSKPYLCSAGVPTIGYGATYYPNGKRVSLTDESITEEWAEVMLAKMLEYYEQEVDAMTTDLINQHQFDALVSFAYNCGTQNLKKSTLLKIVNINPNEPNIELEFMKWNKAKGKTIAGLTKRRAAEAALYFKK